MTQVFGHRGASGSQPENTLAAFATAIEMGAHGMELDVRRASDGSVVVHHDAHLADGRAIVELDRASLPAEVPNLADVLELCADVTVNVEIKSDKKDPDFDPTYAISRSVVDIAQAQAGLDHIIITSFDHDAVDCLRADGVAVRTGYISMVPPNWDRIVDRGHFAFMPWLGLVTEQFVAQAKRRDLFVGTWTVNEVDDIDRVIAAGVDAVISNYPDRVVERLAAR